MNETNEISYVCYVFIEREKNYLEIEKQVGVGQWDQIDHILHHPSSV